MSYPFDFDDHIGYALGADERFAEELGLAGDGVAVAYFRAKNPLLFGEGV